MVKVVANTVPFSKEATSCPGIWLDSQLAPYDQHAIGSKNKQKTKTSRPSG